MSRTTKRDIRTNEVKSESRRETAVRHDLSDIRLYVTDHCRARYTSRIDPTEPLPDSRIEREFREANAVELSSGEITDPARIHPESGVVYVFNPHDGAIITCLRPSAPQLEAVESHGVSVK